MSLDDNFSKIFEIEIDNQNSNHSEAIQNKVKEITKSLIEGFIT